MDFSSYVFMKFVTLIIKKAQSGFETGCLWYIEKKKSCALDGDVATRIAKVCINE